MALIKGNVTTDELKTSLKDSGLRDEAKPYLYVNVTFLVTSAEAMYSIEINLRQ